MHENFPFREVFFTAVGNEPYDYQCRLACGERDGKAEKEWLYSGQPCTSRLISIPTGLGKTAAVVLAWLWNRVIRKDETWPRRLVYCLPMRTLVEQTTAEITRWLENLARQTDIPEDLKWLAEHSPVILMGGEENDPARREWDIYPERPAILVGTQDMLLSRALNRGYGMSRARWPMHFGLLNNDCLWVMDETQLMDVGLATSAQLQAFRTDEQLKTPRQSFTWWMSATLQPDWLQSPETTTYLKRLTDEILNTSDADRQGVLWSEVRKELNFSDVLDEKKLASFAIEKSVDAKTTLVIVNTVKRAIEVYNAIVKDKGLKAKMDIYLCHSRFRPCDRKHWRDSFLNNDTSALRSKVIVSTQVVEAGVDISADVLITELAPWASLVQRFGRAARYGGQASVYVVDVEEKKAAPYDYVELEAARNELKKLDDVSIQSLETFENTMSPSCKRMLYPYSPQFLLLRRELDDLFDTSADLTGADLDVSRFIRSGEENDCHIAWVSLDKGEEPSSEYQPAHDELCAVPIGDAREFIKKQPSSFWKWDYLDRAWIKTKSSDIHPGLRLLARADAGGYNEKCGFNLTVKATVPCVVESARIYIDSAADAAQSDESLSEMEQWQTIAEHGKCAVNILRDMNLVQSDSILDAAILWHDLGKAHPAFVSIIKSDDAYLGEDIAKAPQNAWNKPIKYKISDEDMRPGFRHELASMLALLDLLRQCAPGHEALLGQWTDYFGASWAHPPSPPVVSSPVQEYLSALSPNDFNLFLYLVASHHGKVRTRLQASPNDQTHPVSKAGDAMPLCGVLEGDKIQPIHLAMPDGTITQIPETHLTLAPAILGLSEKTGISWSERCTSLLALHGPFALAWFEVIVRAADSRSSKVLIQTKS